MTGNYSAQQAQGPLVGLRVVEIAGLGPGPHCAMLLADLGAEVLRFERAEGNEFPNPVLDRGRHVVPVNLKDPADVARCRAAVAKADVLIEGFRPGVMERLGLGPDQLCADNPRLVYARLTGWGQDGPLAARVGHDINYIALAGALGHCRADHSLPVPPLNLVGDYGGGSLFAAFGIMAALWERQRSGRGQVIDAAIVDGTAAMMAVIAGFASAGSLSLEPSRNMLGGAAPFYRCYTCADGREVAVGALEPRFYRELLRAIEAPESYLETQYEVSEWPSRAQEFARIFARKTRDEWCATFAGIDACFAPVLSISDAAQNEHLKARGTYVEVDGVVHPAPAPRFSRTPGAPRESLAGEELLGRWGVEPPSR